MKNLILKLSLALLLMVPALQATSGVSDAQAQGVAILSDGTILISGWVTLNNITQFMTAHFSSLGSVERDVWHQWLFCSSNRRWQFIG